MNDKLRWGIISTGRIAGIFAEQIPQTEHGRLYAVASRELEKAENFAEKYGAEKFYGSYDELINDAGVDIVYIATPHPMHAEWALKSAEARKHILCEKPMTMNSIEASSVISAAKESGVFLMEAFHYRCHPQTARIVELIREGVVGDVRVIKATFSFDIDCEPSHRILNRDLGGGGILDVGCYCVSMVRLLAGVAQGKSFLDPDTIRGAGITGSTGVDEFASCVMTFPGNILAVISAGIQVHQENVVEIFGTRGSIKIPTPWVISIRGGVSSIFQRNHSSGENLQVDVKAEKGLFAIEADTVTSAIRSGKKFSEAMSWEDSLGNMNTLDRWRSEIGLTYDADK